MRLARYVHTRLFREFRQTASALSLQQCLLLGTIAGTLYNCEVCVQDVEKKKPVVVKYGLNHVTQLVESGDAQLVVVAHDVDPIELVLWLPALCKKQGIPYCIVKVCVLLLRFAARFVVEAPSVLTAFCLLSARYRVTILYSTGN